VTHKIVGNPSVPDISWSDEQLEQIKALGVNMVQLSIAWGNKTADEVLNLEDLDAGQREKFAFRIKQAKKHGLKPLAHFGIPRMLNYSPVRPACILDPEVQKKYRELLTDFMTSFPEVDDVMVYTFDQRAWLCSEFGPCPRCSGLPLDERLPGFLDMLNETMQKCRPNTRLWWKPWELSRGQVVTILNKVQPEHFGLMLNPSTSNEVYPFNDRSFKSDLGVKRFVQLAKEHNIPVIGEFDHTFYKPLYLMEDITVASCEVPALSADTGCAGCADDAERRKAIRHRVEALRNATQKGRGESGRPYGSRAKTRGVPARF